MENPSISVIPSSKTAPVATPESNPFLNSDAAPAIAENHPLKTSNSLTNRGVFISTYGCQMNVNDTERMFA
ncbi:MAG: hypothetical protein K2X47_19500, partial [Bdellovibrionales bacterium]|nr:hypothetical protein [Bdellovibrionales bacterium]